MAGRQFDAFCVCLRTASGGGDLGDWSGVGSFSNRISFSRSGSAMLGPSTGDSDRDAESGQVWPGVRPEVKWPETNTPCFDTPVFWWCVGNNGRRRPRRRCGARFNPAAAA